MLTSISIANLGLIQKTQIQFDAGFTVITGETGAGKSFFCRAIELSLGSRAKEKSYSGDSKTIIETVFGEHIFRRVLENGKSRFFIDDCPRSLSEGQAFSLQHFDMHSQHENAFLRKPNSASVLLDASLSNSKWKKDFLLAYGEYKKKEKKLLETNALIEQQKLQQEFLAFQKQKMESVSFTLEEVEEAEKEVQSSEKFLDQKEYIESSINLLAGEQSALEYIDEADKFLRKIDQNLSDKTSILFSTIQDIVGELEKRRPDNTEHTQQSKVFLKNIHRLTREFSVVSAAELLEKKDNIHAQISEYKNLCSEQVELENELEKLKKTAIQAATVLSEERKKRVSYFSKYIQKKCQEMGMLPARFEVSLTPTDLQSTGMETVDFLFSANKNQEIKPLRDIASGGEMARIMLALKYFWPSQSTMIFDEIDTGVSGAIAEKMANEMKNLSKNRQIIAISHLPQIAAKADHHFVVEKEHGEDISVTHLRKVTGQERIEVIARMLSGNEVTQEALKAAEKLIK